VRRFRGPSRRAIRRYVEPAAGLDGRANRDRVEQRRGHWVELRRAELGLRRERLGIEHQLGLELGIRVRIKLRIHVWIEQQLVGLIQLVRLEQRRHLELEQRRGDGPDLERHLQHVPAG
jgi:hypothetical protein